jgi:hypothetical protein
MKLINTETNTLCIGGVENIEMSDWLEKTTCSGASSFYWSHQINKTEIGRACSVIGAMEKCLQNFSWILRGESCGLGGVILKWILNKFVLRL